MSHFSNFPRKKFYHGAVDAVCEGFYFIEFNARGEVYSIELGEGVSTVLGQDTRVIIEQMGWSDFLVFEHQHTFSLHRRQLNQGQIGLSAYQVLQADGGSRWVIDSARPLWGEGEDFVGAIEGRLINFGDSPGIAQYIKSLLIGNN